MKMHKLILAGAGALALALTAGPASAQKKYDEGASDTEIKIGNTNPYSGNASSYGTIGKTIEAYFKMVNDKGGINGRKVNFITYDDGYAPPKTVEMVRKLVEEDKVLFVFQTLGTTSQHGDPQVHERQEGAASVRGHRRLGLGQAQGVPVDHGLAAGLRDGSHHLRQAHPGQREGREDRGPHAERRLRP